jgi:phosphatidylglycerophosphate synthase
VVRMGIVPRDVAILVEGEPASRLLGLTMLSRAVLAFANGGALRVFLVGDPRDAAEEARRKTQIPIATVADLETARQAASGPLVIASSAFVYDPGKVRAWIESEGKVEAPMPPLAPAATSAEREGAVTALLSTLIKPTDGFFSVHLNRKVSLAVTRRIVDTGITPNTVTLIANAIGFFGVWLCFRGAWLSLLFGALLVQAQSILDGVDGEIARLRYLSSHAGEWLDNVLDDFVNIGYGIGLGFASSVLTGRPIYFWLGLLAGFGFLLYNLVVYAQLYFVHHSGNPFRFRWWFQRPGEDVAASLRRAGAFARLGATLRALGRRDVFLLAYLLLVALRMPQVAVIWWAILAVGYVPLTVAHVGIASARALRRRS